MRHDERAMCGSCGVEFTTNKDGSIRKHHPCGGRSPVAAPSRIASRARHDRIVAIWNEAPDDAKPTLQAVADQIAAEFGVSFTRERVRQIFERAGIAHTTTKRDARARARLARQRDRLLVAMADALTRPPCRICGAWIIRGSKYSTCGPDCAAEWVRVRYLIDPDEHHKHRIRIARMIVKNPDKYGGSKLAWARRMLSDNPPPPNRRYVVRNLDYADRVKRATPLAYAARSNPTTEGDQPK